MYLGPDARYGIRMYLGPDTRYGIWMYLGPNTSLFGYLDPLRPWALRSRRAGPAGCQSVQACRGACVFSKGSGTSVEILIISAPY